MVVMYIADQNSIPMNFINQSVGIYLWDSPFSHSLYQGMTDQVLWWWSNLLRFQSTSFNAILSIKCEKEERFFYVSIWQLLFPKKREKTLFLSALHMFFMNAVKVALALREKDVLSSKNNFQSRNEFRYPYIFHIEKMCIQKELRLAIRQKINKNAGISNSTTKKNAYNQLVISCLAYFSCKTPKLEVLHFCGKII